MIRVSDLPDYLLLVGVDVAILFFWWKLMALLGDRRMLPSPEVAADVEIGSIADADTSPAFGGKWGQDPTWKTFPSVVKLTMIVALIVSIGILIEGALLMPIGVAVWGWQTP